MIKLNIALIGMLVFVSVSNVFCAADHEPQRVGFACKFSRCAVRQGLRAEGMYTFAIARSLESHLTQAQLDRLVNVVFENSQQYLAGAEPGNAEIRTMDSVLALEKTVETHLTLGSVTLFKGKMFLKSAEMKVLLQRGMKPLPTDYEGGAVSSSIVDRPYAATCISGLTEYDAILDKPLDQVAQAVFEEHGIGEKEIVVVVDTAGWNASQQSGCVLQ